jgi:hypothetical protein
MAILKTGDLFLPLEEYSLPAEITVVSNGNYTTKIFETGVVVRFPNYSFDVKCYEEVIGNRKVHVIKGNNAEIIATNENDVLFIVGNNNFIYHKGKKHNVIVTGIKNYIYDPVKSTQGERNPVGIKIKNNTMDNVTASVEENIEAKTSDTSNQKNIWKTVKGYF